MQVSEMRRSIAGLFQTTDEFLRQKQQRLYQEPALREVLPGRRAAGDREGLVATASATALVALAAMVSQPRERIGRETVRLWEAALVTTGGMRAISRFKLAGGALTALLLDGKLRSNLDRLEIDQDIPEVVLIWRGGRRTVYAPYSSKDWRRRVDEVAERGVTRAVKLPAISVQKIADLLKTEGSAQAAS